MITGSIARRWAKALFMIGEEQGNLMGLVREVASAADAWEVSEELRVSMTNPMLAVRTRDEIWQATIRRIGATRVCANFLKLLNDKGRLTQLPSISRELQTLSDKKDNRVRAHVASAVPVPPDVVTKLKIAIKKSTGKTVVVTTEEDPALIGGIVTRIGDLMFDGSIKTQLQRIKEGMLGG